MKKILFFVDKLKATFWFIPALIILISILLSIGLVTIDESLSLSQDGIGRFLFVNSADSARSILTTISGAMIGVAGTVFSITLVALTLASSQFGPRLIRNFMYVRLNQVVLGTYVSTYIYCLFVLSAIKQGDAYSFIPSLSILVAIFVALINIILLIVFIHQIATSIQADQVISDISNLLHQQVKTIYPDKLGEELDLTENIDINSEIASYPHVRYVIGQKSGYLQYVDNDSLIDIVDSSDGLLILQFKPGEYIVEGVEIARFYTKKIMETTVLKAIANQFIIGDMKSAKQDIEYSIHQMVEIAVRALSPGVNDPFTAIACIDNLSATMCYLSQAKFPSPNRVNEEGKLRIVAFSTHFEGALNASFNQIRQFSAGSPAVIIRLMEALITVSQFAKKEVHKKAILKHAQMVLNTGKTSIEEAFDYEDLLERSKKIL